MCTSPGPLRREGRPLLLPPPCPPLPSLVLLHYDGALWLCDRVPDLQSGGCMFAPRSTQPSIPPGSVNNAGNVKAIRTHSDYG